MRRRLVNKKRITLFSFAATLLLAGGIVVAVGKVFGMPGSGPVLLGAADPGTLNLVAPEKILIGNPDSSATNGDKMWGAYTFTVENPSNVEYTNVTMSVSGTTGCEFSTASTTGAPATIPARTTIEVTLDKCYVNDAYNSETGDYVDQTRTLEINYDGQSVNYQKTANINFYHRTLPINKIPQTAETNTEFEITYSGNADQPFFIKINRTNVSMDMSESLDSQNVTFSYKTTFGNFTTVFHPQDWRSQRDVWRYEDGNLNVIADGGPTPRMWWFFDYTGKDGGDDGSRLEQLDSYEKGNYSDWWQHTLYGAPKTTTNGVEPVYYPVYAIYSKNQYKKWWYDQNYRYSTTNNTTDGLNYDQHFSGIENVAIQLSIYDKSNLYASLNQHQYLLDAGKQWPSNLYDTATYQTYLDGVAALYNSRTFGDRLLTQADVTEAYNTLEGSQPQPLRANYSGYEATVNAYHNRADLDLFTDESKQAIEDMIDEIPLNYTALEQSTLDNDVADLQYAIAHNLVYKPADYSGLVSEINAASGRLADEPYYTAESWSTFSAAYAAAVTANTDQSYDITQQETVTGLATDLHNAIEGLTYRPADKTALIEAINLAGTKEESQYTATSWAAMQQKLTVANTINNNSSIDVRDQNTINIVTNELVAAINALEEKPADYSELEAAIASAGTKIESWYTTETWAALQEALEAANAVPTDLKIKDQATVTAAANALNDAIAGLIEADADYSVLNATIAEAEALNENAYTPESWQNLQNVLPTARSIAGTPITARYQETIDNITALLRGAIDNLQPIYQIINGADQSYDVDSGNSLIVSANGALAKFVELRVDDEVLDESLYTVVSGSTIVTLSPGYLDTLSVGVHTLTFVYTDGTVSTHFTINAAHTDPDDPDTPDTPDTPGKSEDSDLPSAPDTLDNVLIWAIILGVSVVAGASVYRKIRR